MSERGPINITVQRFAVLTCLVALLPITVGALVTTLKAGMAFADWPTSDGHNMILYPWLSDLRHTDKFVEHGHRLAGVLIGLVSVALVIVTFVKEKQAWVRRGAVAILVAVIAQGLLGGMRVRMNEQVLAMTHSITGGLFFTLCFLFAILTRRGTGDSKATNDTRVSPVIFGAGVLLPIPVLGQYVLGGMFRHLGRMLHEHLAGAIIVSLLSVVVLSVVLRSDMKVLRRRGQWLLSAILVQLSLGVGSWVTKLGVPAFGWVASINSPAQNVVCSLHTVGGMLLLATTTAMAIELLMLAKAGSLKGLSLTFDPGHAAGPSSASGGAA